MADTKTKAEEMSKQKETATMPTTAPAPRPAGMAAVQSARVRPGSEPKRLSKGLRKHLRRQKQAAEIKVTPKR